MFRIPTAGTIDWQLWYWYNKQCANMPWS